MGKTMKRREFIKTTAAAGVAAALMPKILFTELNSRYCEVTVIISIICSSL